MFFQKLFRDRNIAVRYRGRVEPLGAFMFAGFHQVFAIRRAANGDLAFGAAADGADLAAHARTVAAGAAFLADGA